MSCLILEYTVYFDNALRSAVMVFFIVFLE